MRDAAAWRALVHSMRGQVNVLAVHDMLQPVPRGTARGTWTAGGRCCAAPSELTIQLGASEAGKTLLQGDWIGVNQGSNHRQMLHIQSDAVADASGSITVRFEPVLRTRRGGRKLSRLGPPDLSACVGSTPRPLGLLSRARKVASAWT